MLVMMMVGCDLLSGVVPGATVGSDNVPEGYTECGAEAWMNWRDDCGDDVGSAFPSSSCVDRYCGATYLTAVVVCAPGGDDAACCDSISCWDELSACVTQDCDDANADDDFFVCSQVELACEDELE